MMPRTPLLALFLSAMPCVAAAETALRWGDDGYFSKWKRPGYEIPSRYPFLSELPTLDRFPELLKLGEDGSVPDSDFEILRGQLVAISRCDFLDEFSGKEPAVQRREALQRWRAWWDYHGKSQAVALVKEGKAYPEVWRGIAPSPYLPCPSYPLLLPPSWSFKLTFSSGDYAGVVTETIRMECSAEKALLVRRYQAATSAPWISESWEGFTVEEARAFLAALIYSVDHPWFFAGDELAEKKPHGGIGRIVKRPKEWTDYHPTVRWTGVLDSGGRVILNENPWAWEVLDHKLSRDPRLDEAIGVVFRLIMERFPDPSYGEEASRWKRSEESGNEK